MGDVECVLGKVAGMFAELAEGLRPADPSSVFEAVTEVALKRVPGTSAASITVHDGTRFSTRYSTDDLARDADRIQYELAAGPAVDVIRGAELSHVADALGEQWRTAFGRRLAEHQYLTALSVRLCDRDDSGGVATALNLYSEPAQAFDPVAVRMATLLAAHGGMVLAQVRGAERVTNLERALVSNKEIGPAIGLIMAQHRIGHDQAMGLLRKISQKVNRKVSDLAVEVVETGALRQSIGPLTPSRK